MANIVAIEEITTKILVVRGKKVMLDRDLAQLYGVETRVLNQAVKRNRSRFPADFVFLLTREEIKRISQFVISLKFSKTAYVFTEQGVAMLSSVLNSERAIQVNILIMRAFTKLRATLLTHKELANKIDALENKYSDHEEKIKVIFEAIRQLIQTPYDSQRKITGFSSK